ncbi:MAG: 50S ribosomal protein L31e [Hadesarchaea archaeon]|nr:MAG: 50S ribosomal protein L31e [Hadesarchaea archaeon]TDA33887.1 MAG: 50S ribosomal protein L31e [Hadesarchaea archaeon]
MPEERIYVIPLRETKEKPRYKRANKAIDLIRKFLMKHLKTEKVKIDQELNRRIWSRGAKKPPSKIRVKAVKKEDGSVEVFLAE